MTSEDQFSYDFNLKFEGSHLVLRPATFDDVAFCVEGITAVSEGVLDIILSSVRKSLGFSGVEEMLSALLYEDSSEIFNLRHMHILEKEGSCAALLFAYDPNLKGDSMPTFVDGLINGEQKDLLNLLSGRSVRELALNNLKSKDAVNVKTSETGDRTFCDKTKGAGGSFFFDDDSTFFDDDCDLKGRDLKAVAAGRLFYVNTLYTAARYRGQNLGKILLAKALDLAFKKDFEGLFLHCFEDNEKAAGFYEALGFKSILKVNYPEDVAKVHPKGGSLFAIGMHNLGIFGRKFKETQLS